jgi:molybdate transport system regulatory protein
VEFKCKFWLEKKGELVFGEGLYTLLVYIDKYGSINQAAIKSKMSYRQAWGKIKKAEERLGFKLLDKTIGGETGGGAQLTADARKIMRKYEELEKELNHVLKVFNHRNNT